MAIFKDVWINICLVVILLVLEKAVLEEGSSFQDFQDHLDNPWLPHTRQRRNALGTHEVYEVDLELNLTDLTTLDQFRSLLPAINGSLTLSSDLIITQLEITTVCSPNGTDFVCRCEDEFAWPAEDCLTYGACSEIVNDTCACVASIPPDGPYCQPRFTQPEVYKYEILLEINTTLLVNLTAAINLMFPLEISSHVNVSEAEIITVCSPGSDGFQCVCADEYRWSCDQCEMYESCDNITNNTCGCISEIPATGPYCLSVNEHDFAECRTTTTTTTQPTTTTPIATTTPTTTTPTTTTPTTTITTETTITTPTTTITTTTPTTTPNVEEYLVLIELNITDGDLIPGLRNLLRNSSAFMDPFVEIAAINISTVCSPSSSGFQCMCEDQFRWSCDQCQRYQSCDDVVNDTCGCIGEIPPDGAFCRPVDEHNFTECVITTPTTTTPITTTTPTTTPTTTITTPTTTITTPTTTTPTTTITTPTTTPTTPTTTITTPTTTTPTTTITTPTTTTPTTTPTTTTTPATTITTPTTTTTPATTITTPTTTPPPTTTVTTPTTTMTTTTPTTTTTTTPTTTPTTPTPTPEPPVQTVTMSVTLDLDFTQDLLNSDSARYIQLSTELTGLLTGAYGRITGFRGISITRFRPGSVIVDFSLTTTAFIADQIQDINENLTITLTSIAPVLGSVVAQYNSPTRIAEPKATFTGGDMTLTCGPPEVDVGIISGSEWKFEGFEIMQGRRTIDFENSVSTLTVTNVIRSDNGSYECTLTGEPFDYIQRGTVPANRIVESPLVRLQESINTQCQVGRTQSLECCVQTPFRVGWVQNGVELVSVPSTEEGCIIHEFTIVSCNQPTATETFTCRVEGQDEAFSRTTTLTLFTDEFVCEDDEFGEGRLGDRANGRCPANQQGNKIAECTAAGIWDVVENTCILTEINEFLIDSVDLSEEQVPEFTERFSETVQDTTEDIVQSPATIGAVVDILNTIADVAVIADQNVTQNVLEIVDAIIGDDASDSWDFLNTNETLNTSSRLLGSLETFTDRIEGTFAVETSRILFNRTTYNNSFTTNLNSSVTINILPSDVSDVSITTISLSTLNNVMPTRNSSFNSTNDTSTTVINAAVVLIRISDSAPGVNLSYTKLNTSLEEEPQCVFWNFTRFDSLGAWDSEGCFFVSQENDTVTCSCNHLTSFSILMSTDIPRDIIILLDIITYVGVGISMASLVICLIIEGYVWKAVTRNSTAFMRHVSIINTALSLLIANICFIIGAAIAKNPSENPNEDHEVPLDPCSTATFFMHFFYLAVFFWMLVSALLLLYRTVMVFSQMSKSAMLGIGFTLGYVCPLLIAVITVAVTAPGRGYIRKDLACWLNWTDTMALLAMVIPALVIVTINFVVLLIVLFKMLRRGTASVSQPDEKHTIVVVIRCVAILTPLFGLTWGLGVGTMIFPNNRGIHIAFAFFNSFQGFFILVFGTLLDSKVRALLSRRIPALSTGTGSGSRPTQSTSGGLSSSGGNIFGNIFRRNRNIYRVSEATTSNGGNSSASEAFINT